MANLFDVYNDGLLIDHTEGAKLETGETPITISGLTADTTYDKVQVAYAGSYNKSDVPSFKTNLGRNLILNSSCINASDSSMPILKGASYNLWAETNYLETGLQIINNKGNSEWYYGFANAWTNISNTPLVAGNIYTLSVKVSGSVPQVAFRVGFKNAEGSLKFLYNYTNVKSDVWTKLVYTFTIPSDTTSLMLRVHGANNNQYSTGFTGNESFIMKELKLEAGNVATDWIPAPEDSVT